MTIGDPVQHLVCNCNMSWSSVLPPPPCPWHAPQAHNGLCNCPAQQGLHPLHRPSWTSTTTRFPPIMPRPGAPDLAYEGKHRP